MKIINKVEKLFAAIISITCLSVAPLMGQGVSVTMDPSTDQIIAPGGTVAFKCTANGGCKPYTYSWSFGGTSQGTSSQQNPGTVTFDQGAGNENKVTVTVTDSSIPPSTGTATINVDVPIIVGVGIDFSGQENDIWFFSNGDGTEQYPVQLTAILHGISAEKAGTITWTITGENDTVNFDNNQQTKTEASVTETIHSIGFSQNEGQLTLTAVVNGITVKSGPFTSRTAYSLNATGPVDTPISETYQTFEAVGYNSRYTYQVSDKFGLGLGNLTMCEWLNNLTQDMNGENWGQSVNYRVGNVTLGANGADADDFGKISIGNFGNNGSITFSDVPTAVVPSDADATKKVDHQNQSYLFGGDGDNLPNHTPTGYDSDDEVIQMYRGIGRHL